MHGVPVHVGNQVAGPIFCERLLMNERSIGFLNGVAEFRGGHVAADVEGELLEGVRLSQGTVVIEVGVSVPRPVVEGVRRFDRGGHTIVHARALLEWRIQHQVVVALHSFPHPLSDDAQRKGRVPHTQFIHHAGEEAVIADRRLRGRGEGAVGLEFSLVAIDLGGQVCGGAGRCVVHEVPTESNPRLQLSYMSVPDAINGACRVRQQAVHIQTAGHFCQTWVEVGGEGTHSDGFRGQGVHVRGLIGTWRQRHCIAGRGQAVGCRVDGRTVVHAFVHEVATTAHKTHRVVDVSIAHRVNDTKRIADDPMDAQVGC